MRKIILALLVLCAACSKNNNGSTTANFTFTANDTPKNYTITASTSSIVDNTYLLTLAGSSDDTSDPGNLILNLASPLPFSTGETFSNAIIAGTETMQAQLEYSTFISLPLWQNSLSRVVIRLTSVSGDAIQGTFSAILVDRTDTSTVGSTLAAGQFDAPYTPPTP